ncbi:protein lifeguard 3-like [Pelodytes ibericus]
MAKQGEAYMSSNMTNPLPIYYSSTQNPVYAPSNPNQEGGYGPSAPMYMPPPPMYSEQNPAVLPAPAYSPYPPFEQPQQAFLGADNGPKPDVEISPPEYTTGMGDSSPFSESAIRRAFIRKVYITLALQLAVTVGLICMFIFWTTLKDWVQDTPYFAYALFPGLIILIVVLTCCENARRKVPYNFILLAIFTVVEGCMLGAISALFEADAVMWAGGATIVVTLGLTLFALQTKWDFTMMSGGLCVALLVLLCFGMLAAILRSFWLDIVYACIGTFIFGMYIVVDTQLIVGGKHRYSTSPEEYIFAALNIYLDIVNLFMFLLQIFGLCR